MRSCCKMAFLVGLIVGQPLFARGQIEKPASVDHDLLAGVEDEAPVRNANENFAESRAYNFLLVHAHKFSAAELRDQARTDLTFIHLFEEPAKYRGELITLKGRLRRLTRYDPPEWAVKEAVPNLYEGWLYAEGSFSNPFCVLASEIGPDLQPGQKIDREVTYAGYFFKRYRYKAGDGWRDAPLLIGRCIELSSETPEPVPSLIGSLYMPAIFAILGATLLLALGLAWRLRLSDSKVRARLQEIRNEQSFTKGSSRIEPDAPTRSVLSPIPNMPDKM